VNAVNKKWNAGFTFIELMVVVAVIGVLSAIALPEYSRHISRVRAIGTISETTSLRLAVVTCIAGTGRMIGCDGGGYGIPSDAIFISTKNTLTVVVKDGEIMGTSGATAIDGSPLTYLMTPVLSASAANMSWLTTGTICDAARGLKPGFGGCA